MIFSAISGLKLSVISHVQLSGHILIHFLLRLFTAKTKSNIFLDENDDCLLGCPLFPEFFVWIWPIENLF